MTDSSSPPRRAIIIAVGSELLTPLRADTNSLFVTARLNELGIEVVAKLIVGDRRDDLSAAIRDNLGRADLLVLTGGLGPTDDDVTRQAASDALGLALHEDPAIVERIRERFARRGLEMPGVNLVQAQVLAGASVLANPNGTAPGQWIECAGTRVVLLPGPPREMQPMIVAALDARLAPSCGSARVYRRVIGIAGRAESQVEQVAQPIYSTWAEWDPPVSTSILAAPGQIELHLSVRASSEDEGMSVLERATSEVLPVLGDDVFSTDGRPLEQVVGEMLRARFWRIATAESCTGGLVASRLTDIPGSSDYVERGVVCYSNRRKDRSARRARGVDSASTARSAKKSAWRWLSACANGRAWKSPSPSPASPALAEAPPRSRSARWSWRWHSRAARACAGSSFSACAPR